MAGRQATAAAALARAPAPAPAEAQQTRVQLQVQVPPGVQPGQVLDVAVISGKDEQHYNVTVPEGLSAGDTFTLDPSALAAEGPRSAGGAGGGPVRAAGIDAEQARANRLAREALAQMKT